MKNLAVKYLCTGIVTFVTLCGGMSVSAQNLVVQNPGILVTKPAGITSVLTPERSIRTLESQPVSGTHEMRLWLQNIKQML